MAATLYIDIALSILLGLHILVFIPLCIYVIRIFYHNWNEVYFRKRRRRITLWMVVLCCIPLMLSQPALIIVAIISNNVFALSPYILLIGISFDKFSFFACSLLLLTRCWLYYYDIKYTKELSSHEWKVLLNDYRQDYFEKQLWYSMKRHSYGCDIWCSKRVLLISFCVTVIYDTLSVIKPDYAHIFSACIYISLYILCAFGWYKYPKFNDIMGIRHELKRILISWSIGTIFIECNIILNRVLFNNKFSGLMVVAMYCMSFNLIVVVYVTIIAVFRRSKKDETELSQQLQYQDVKIKSWKPIVQTMDGYSLFMNHLQKEFSCENLLFVTEYAQFKEELLKNASDEMDTIQAQLVWKLELPTKDKLPIGSITCGYLHKMEEAKTLKTCHKLYEKYIQPGATFEVNISSGQRKNIVESMAIMNEEEVYRTLLHFETAVMSIEALMNDSFSRFRQTPIAKEFWARFIM